MKFDNAWSISVLIAFPAVILLHICLNLFLLAKNVTSHAAYIAGDISIVALSGIFIVLFNIYSRKSQIGTEIEGQIHSQNDGRINSQVHDPKRTRVKAKRMIFAIGCIGSFLLSIWMLWSVRFDFTGQAYTGAGTEQFSHQKIRMPFFVDEWTVAGYAQKVAEKHVLPAFNPFYESEKIQNFLAPLIAGLAGFMISTGIDIVPDYFVYVWIFQFLFVSAFYLFCRANGVSRIASLVAVLLLIFLPESNLTPNIWVMLPAYIGAIPLMLAFVLNNLAEKKTYYLDMAMQQNAQAGQVLPQDAAKDQEKLVCQRRLLMVQKGGSILNVVAACLIYPPYVVAAAIYIALRFVKNILAFALFRKDGGKARILQIFLYTISAIATGIVILKASSIAITMQSLTDIWHAISSALVHNRFWISTEKIWTYIPAILFFTSIAGLVIWITQITKSDRRSKTQIIYTIMFCLIYLYIVYINYYELIFSHQRIVFALWLMMIAMSGIVFDALYGGLLAIIKRMSHAKRAVSKTVESQQVADPQAVEQSDQKIAFRIKSLVLCLLIILQISIISLSYSNMVRWEGVVAQVYPDSYSISSRPVVAVLLPDDFEQIVETANNRHKEANAEKYAQRAQGIRLSMRATLGQDKDRKILGNSVINQAVGISTSLKPVNTADSIFTVNNYNYYTFRSLETCKEKHDAADEYDIDLIIIEKDDVEILDQCPQEFTPAQDLGSFYRLYSVNVF